MCFFHILQLGEEVSSLFSNFGIAWTIIKIQSAKLVRISQGVTKYPPIIHTCRYTDTTGHTEYEHCMLIIHDKTGFVVMGGSKYKEEIGEWISIWVTCSAVKD
jgi:hypothetical protein